MPGVRGLNPTLLVFRALIAFGLVFCPLLRFSAAAPPVTPTQSAPSPGPTGQPEEEKSEETKSSAGSSATARGGRPSGPSDERSVASPTRTSNCRSGALPRAASADPFRNGLGCPFRC
jgi:hypothetical protein